MTPGGVLDVLFLVSPGSHSGSVVIPFLLDFDRLQVTFVPFEEDASGEVCQKIGNVYQISLVQRDNEEW